MSIVQEYVTVSMCEALERAQLVRSHDYAGLYYQALGGTSSCRPMRSAVEAASIEGKLLAVALVKEAWRAA